MNKLSYIPFPPTPILDTSSGDIIKDFFNPALAVSITYDRGVGFFSAAWLRLSAKGMAEFAGNNGRARWVTSPILGEADWQALQDEALRNEVEAGAEKPYRYSQLFVECVLYLQPIAVPLIFDQKSAIDSDVLLFSPQRNRHRPSCFFSKFLW